MNNYSIYSNTELIKNASNTLQPIYIDIEGGVNYTELGIFISGILLSCGGFLALLLGNIRRSNCKEVNCLCFKCKRENLNIDEV
jgi:hypothetical protein